MEVGIIRDDSSAWISGTDALHNFCNLWPQNGITRAISNNDKA